MACKHDFTKSSIIELNFYKIKTTLDPIFAIKCRKALMAEITRRQRIDTENLLGVEWSPPPPDTTQIQGKKYKPASKGDFELLKLKIEAAKRKDTLLAKLKQCSCT